MTPPGDAPPLRIAILNRFAPPDGAPTATAAAELARDLAAALPRAEITLYASSANYRPGTAPQAGPAAEPDWPTRRVASLYAGRWPPARLIASLLEGWALARRAAREADVVISLTDPPLLSLWVGPACRRWNRRWIEWTLDRYPEFFAAAGLVSERHPLYRLLVRRDARLRPDAVIGLGAGQLAHLAARRGTLPPSVILPVGLTSHHSDEAMPSTPTPAAVPPMGPPPPHPGDIPPQAPDAPLTLVYAGNLGEAHDPAALAAIVGRADPARFRFAFAVSGRHADRLRRDLAGHPAVSWHERLTTADLAGAAAHLVSLSGRATHLSVPSKAVTAVCLGRPFLFTGSAEADTWRDLGAAGWLIAERSDGTLPPAAIDAALAALADPAGRVARAAAARALAAGLQRRRSEALATLAAIITAL